MLVLRRKNRQQIQIGDDIKITVFLDSNKRNLAFIGVNAPKNVSIMRMELTDGERKKFCKNSTS